MAATSPVADISVRAPLSPPERRAWVALAITMASTAAYAVFIVLPFFANGLQSVPVDEVVNGAYDPATLWPLTTAWGAPFSIGAFIMVWLAPLTAICVLVWAAFSLFASPATGRTRALMAGAAVVSMGFLAWFATPLSSTIITWMLD